MSYYKRLSTEEQLKKVNGMIERKQIELVREKERERKRRAHRLIQKGALLEKYLDIEHLEVEDTEELLKMFSSFLKEKIPEKYKKKET
ncbi:hypothetical protein QU577_27570 [Priestia megaterium]|uniref:hypothetical protein n=1 Tax=Priestia megaterium TaxID=1404 RepID=UPI0025B1F74E|nr:hypothetical protein [Priestia megaterium]MDN3365505.1 hypothetical protein [Priestia megaterium]